MCALVNFFIFIFVFSFYRQTPPGGRVGRFLGGLGERIGVGVIARQFRLLSKRPIVGLESSQSFWGLQKKGQVDGLVSEIPQLQ